MVVSVPEMEVVNDLPDIRRGGGNASGPYSTAMKNLKVPSGRGENRKFYTFFIPAPTNEELIAKGASAEEVEKDARDKCRKLSNSFAGIARRITKADTSYKFAFRTVYQIADDTTSPLGVRVYRIEA
jgi:hypothetical protein